MELICTFALTALILALAGIYNVMTLSVTLRTQEIAIRMALGAQRSGITKLVLQSERDWPCWAFTASRLRSFLFEVRPTDPWIYVRSILMLGIPYVACLLPALRAASADPIKALRSIT
jgi:ABC-type antimicrobial peptide transport system permease subunit